MREVNEILYWICMLNPFTRAVDFFRFSLYAQWQMLSLSVTPATTATRSVAGLEAGTHEQTPARPRLKYGILAL